ncbi:auxin transporter 1 [Micractinium conductrix]|uniref:Auxin transporter 1 n=1 Tax=Micractinium conductrix TaxID=554055 RepID=A0A2P6V4V4_9CHLO|nr:auxin transporter 1 [Micractinium conductrix]|eukprot:PSC69121.1 auxin transporter 1 [Micractinium conductrix]
MVAGIVMLLLFASLACWTVYLMVVLYLDNKNRKIKNKSWYNSAQTRTIANQYHEVMGSATYRWLGILSRVVVIIALGGLAVAQIIASSSNFHRMIPQLNKRDWALVFGGVATAMSLLPNFRNFRLFSFIALVATTFTAWYIVVMGIQGADGQGLQSSPWTDQKPESLDGFFAGASNIIFTFGGHAMLLEVMDSMFRPYTFHKVFYSSYLYVFTLVLPNSVFILWGWPAQAAQYGNVYTYMPPSVARDISIVLMVLHQVIVFGLFAFPIFYMAEKAVGVHTGAHWKRVLTRLPISLLLWLIALAFPFFGVINDLLGAFTTTFETFIIPCLAYNIHYQLKGTAALNRAESTKPPNKFIQKLGGWSFVFWFNWVIIAFTAVFGFGMGGYSSIKAFVDSVNDFGVFAACYNC